MSSTAKDLLKGIFIKDPLKRFGIEQIKNHKFFSKMDWDGIINKKIIAPFIPNITSTDDTDCFD